MAALRPALPLVCLAAALPACLLYGDGDDDFTPDAALVPDARVDAPTDAPVDAGIDSPRAAPALELTSPADDTLVTGHAAVRIDARVTGNPVSGFDLTVDDVLTAGLLSVTGVPVGGDCFAGCNISFYWDAAAMREGSHTALISVRDDMGATASDSVTLRFEDAPQITFLQPTGEARGARSVGVSVRIVDRGPGSITAALAIDGVAVQNATYADCLTGCPLTRVWDTSALTAGTHTLSVTASDAAGRTTTHTHDVLIGDIPYITQINVNESDGFGTLEVEVHLYDAATSAWLGCSGESEGLAGVAEANVLYNVVGRFIDAQERPVGVDQLVGRQLRFRVVEDDAARCPTPPGSSDDELGQSGTINASSLSDLTTAFGRVNQLTTRHGRPLTR